MTPTEAVIKAHFAYPRSRCGVRNFGEFRRSKASVDNVRFEVRSVRPGIVQVAGSALTRANRSSSIAMSPQAGPQRRGFALRLAPSAGSVGKVALR